MKNRRITLLSIILTLFFLQGTAQVVFWSEDFGTGCNQGNLADNYTTGNGAWAVTSTGYNANYANTWYISATEAGMGVNNCGNGCLNSNLTDRTLHLGNVAINLISLPADQGAAYFSSSSVCLSLSLCGATQKRVESPIIDCSGKSSITMRFLYMENGGATNHNATVWYAYDGGSNWSQIYDPPKIALTCSPQGIWTLDSIALPSSADNNSQVKVGFEWYNDEDDNATDPSFAIDDIELTVPGSGPPPVADFSVSDTIICENDCISFTDLSTNSPTAWFWAFPGGNPTTSTLQNPDSICYATAGSYDVTLTVFNGNGGDTLLKSNHITVNVCTYLPNLTSLQNLSVYPLPADDHVTIDYTSTGQLQLSSLKIYNMFGDEIHPEYVLTSNKIKISRGRIPCGMYLYKLITIDGEHAQGKLICK